MAGINVFSLVILHIAEIIWVLVCLWYIRWGGAERWYDFYTRNFGGPIFLRGTPEEKRGKTIKLIKISNKILLAWGVFFYFFAVAAITATWLESLFRKGF